MSPLVPLLFLGGAYFVMRGGGARGPAGSSATPSGTAGKCITPPRTDFNDLPDEGFWNAFKYALWVDSDPKSLEEFAASCDAVCQPEAARVLRQKAKDLRALGVPDGYSPNGKPPEASPKLTLPMPDGPVAIPIPPTYDPSGGYGYLPKDVLSGAKIPESFPFPVPGIEGTPEPKPGVVVPPVVPGVDLPTPEQTPKLPSAPRAGCRSSADFQWWSVPAKAGESAWSITADYTGSGGRYVELIENNPEKKTVGVKGSSGYNFASLKIGERLRIPKAWNAFVDEQGRADGKGKIWPVCAPDSVGGGGSAGGEWPATATDAQCWKGFKTTGDAMADLARLSTTCAKGMTPVSPPSVRDFAEGEVVELKYPLALGSYRFLAVGGAGAADVNLSLFDASGKRLSADVTADDTTAILHPTKSVVISEFGVYTLKVEMKKGAGQIAGGIWRA
jgi:hypothetical protein